MNWHLLAICAATSTKCADGDHQSYRILFATEGHYQQVLLSLEAFSKKTQKTPVKKIELAEKRLADWRKRGQ